MTDNNKAAQGTIYKELFAIDKICYDDFLISPNDYIRERYFANANPTRGSRVLEIGIGISSFLCRAVRRYHIKGFGLDYVSESLRAQKLSSPYDLRLCRGDSEALPYKNSSFDFVVAISTLEYLSNYNVAFSEIWRVLKPRGILLIQVPCRDFRFSLFARFNLYETLRNEKWFLENQKKSGHDYHRIPDREGWKQMAYQNGFSVCIRDASDVLLDSWMMYYFYHFVKNIQSSFIRLRMARARRKQQHTNQTNWQSVTNSTESMPRHASNRDQRISIKRRLAGFLWYHFVLRAFWVFLIPERALRRLPIGASVYMSLKKEASGKP